VLVKRRRTEKKGGRSKASPSFLVWMPPRRLIHATPEGPFATGRPRDNIHKRGPKN
jgi:hypothetical protein